MKPANQFNPEKSLRSTIRNMPGSPSGRVGVLCDLAGIKRTGLAAALDLHYISLSRVLNGHSNGSEVRGKVADYFGLAVSDIWPEPVGEQAAA